MTSLKQSMKTSKMESPALDIKPSARGTTLKVTEKESGEVTESGGEVYDDEENDDVIDMGQFATTQRTATSRAPPNFMKGNNRGEPRRQFTNQELQKQFDDLVKMYYNSNPHMPKKFKNAELEVKFGTRGIKPLTKNDYDNVIKKLKSLGFTIWNPEGQYMLRIQGETTDPTRGVFKISPFRVEVEGLTNIQEYCKTNDLKAMAQSSSHPYNISIEKKSQVFVDDKPVQSVNFDDFNFRLSYNIEESYNKNSSKVGIDIMNSIDKVKKVFRYINRVTLVRNDLPVKIDLSIVRMSNKQDKYNLKPEYTTEQAGVFTNPESYEIEIEVLNNKMNTPPFMDSIEPVLQGIRKAIKYILSGLQGTNYPISYPEQTQVLTDYMKLFHGEDYVLPWFGLKSGSFIGPSSYTLQIENIAPINDNTNIPNIRKNYTVTDKADGERRLLFISPSGKIYLISTNMEAIFTGAITEDKTIVNTLMDGEIIYHNKLGEFINLFAAFDVYYIHGNDVRANGFMPFTVAEDESKGNKEKSDRNRFRYPLLKSVIKLIKPKSVVPNEMSPIRIEFKRFYPTNPADNIFAACGYIMKKVAAGDFEYNTDGLIFTPALFGVGGSRMGEAGDLKKITWDYSFKWKPAEFNTVDFFVTTSKNASGQDVVTPVFEQGISAASAVQYNQYKTLILRCGFDERDKGYYVNPCQDVYDDIIPEFKQVEEDKDKNTYKPVQFYPTHPADPMGGITNVMLRQDESGVYQMFTEENEVFGDNTIVECKYNLDRDNLWRWIPLRVRYDKTAELNQGGRNYGNAYHVANSNWHSIHNPITVEMITTGKNIPDEIKDDDVYYNRGASLGKGNKKLTIGLRDFHNLYVKNMLISRTSKRGETLIDFACGKGGDFPKWIKANLSFVFGIDVAKDNLENRIDGACARYLNFRREFKSMPGALFVNGNSSLNIKSGHAMLNDKAIQITRSVFGLGAKDEKLGKGVMKYYGVGEDGFNVTSCQFAIHYFFENETTFHNFIRNVAECTKLGGYFIGTSYDGKLVFNRLKKKAQGDSIDIYEDGKRIWGIIKDYDSDAFENDETSLGYQISVYQESINKTFPEYLVNYDYLNLVMEKYGFKLVTRDEAKGLGLPEGSGLFSELYAMMMKNLKRDKTEYGHAPDMKGYEKEISFLNRYFVYKKVVTVNAEKLMATLIDKSQEDLEYEEKQTATAVKIGKKAVSKPRVKKIPKELVLVAATEAIDETPLELEVDVPVEKKSRKPRAKKAVEFVLEPEPDLEQPAPSASTLQKAKKKTSRKSKVPTNLEFVIEE